MHPQQPNPAGSPPHAHPGYAAPAPAAAPAYPYPQGGTVPPAATVQPPQQPAQHPAQPHPGPAAPPPAGGPTPPAEKRSKVGAVELIIDKFVDFILIFVGLYAATAVQRCQDTAKEKQEYAALLKDFKRELTANLEQEASIAKDLGAIEDTTPGENLGPMQATFKHFFEELAEDETIVHCLHEEFAVVVGDGQPHVPPECHALYKQFDQSHASASNSFSFQPVVLTPFYRHEVWQLYLADGVKTFRNKELAVRIAEVYANARLIEVEIKDIESNYNDAFMKQVGRTAATDLELAEIVHDEEQQHGLSPADLTLLLHVDEAIKEEHYAALEVEHILELKVERMKHTVLTMRAEIEDVHKAIDEELDALGRHAK